MTGNTVDDIYPSRWLRADDLEGKARTVTIAHAEAEALRQSDGTKELRIVISFVGKRKQLACNVTQARALAALTGQQVFTKWVGTIVSLYPTVASNGKDTIGIAPAGGNDGNTGASGSEDAEAGATKHEGNGKTEAAGGS